MCVTPPFAIISKQEMSEAQLVSGFSPDDSVDIVKKSLKEQSSLKKLVCTGHKTKFNTYGYFQVSILVDEMPPVKNNGVWPTGCFISPFYGKFPPEQVYSSSRPVKLIKGRAPSVATSRFMSSNTVSPAGASEARAKSGLSS
jgi:hypothetical protein